MGLRKKGCISRGGDTSSRLNALAGGRIFPGKHHLARFDVKEENGHYHIGFTSDDHTSLSVDARSTSEFPVASVFGTLENASAFFAGGAVGYSPNRRQSLDGLKLQTYQWRVSPLELQQVSSSFFEDTALFKKGAVAFDNALLMTRIEHEWHTLTGCPQP